jgi:hypothetical protein
MSMLCPNPDCEKNEAELQMYLNFPITGKPLSKDGLPETIEASLECPRCGREWYGDLRMA